EPRTDGKINDGQRDRYAAAPLDHLIEVAVARIVILLVVAAKRAALEHLAVEGSAPALGRRRARCSVLDRARQIVDESEAFLDIERRVVLRRDQQRAFGEIGIAVGRERVETVTQRLPVGRWHRRLDSTPPWPAEARASSADCRAPAHTLDKPPGRYIY